MITFSPNSKIDLENCLDALLFPINPNKQPLTYEEAHNYIDDIVTFVYSLATKIRHIDCVFEIHKVYGEKAARYDRNKQTQYYVVYNIDSHGNIYVERIMTNHITIS